MGNIADSHQELYHYTTAAGLSGILESKSLRAIHASFMNDEEEIFGFCDRILPKILRPVFSKYFEDIKDKSEFQKLQGNTPFDLYFEEQFAKLIHKSRWTSLWHDYYVTSFSKATEPWVRKHGLLSQWRAYGPDGGYALVFDTGPLNKILGEEIAPYQEESFSWTDVQYGDLNENCRTNDSDTDRLIDQLEAAAARYFCSGSSKDASALSEPLTILSSIFKHRGFAEEQEVRLVLRLLGPALESHPELRSARQHPVKTMVREGTTVPFVELCVREVNGVRQHLPIKRIIIGPHRDKNDRERAVKLLLKQHGLTAEVSVSDIPYRGR